MANVRLAQSIAENLDPNWPKPIKFLAGGANGRVYHTNDGRLMKFVYGYAPQEYESLQKLQGTFVVPRFKKGNGEVMNLGSALSKRVRAAMFPHANMSSHKLTVFIMGGVGGSDGMTLRKYVRTHPTANRANIQRRVEYLISEMKMRGVSHGDLHDANIIVSVSPTGRISGMWAIDFGRSRILGNGVTEREHYNRMATRPNHSIIASMFSPNSKKYTWVPLRNGSRPNVNMMSGIYGKRLSPAWEQKIARLRKQVSSEMKQYKSPSRSSKGTPRRTKSPSPARPRSAPARIATPQKGLEVSLKRRRA